MTDKDISTTRLEYRSRGLILGDPIAGGIVGYLAASFATSLTIGVEILLFQLWRGQAVTVPDLGGLLLVTVFGGLVAASMAWVPAIGFMIYGARTGVRSVSYYAGAGVFCGLFCSFWLSYRAGSSVLVTNMLSYFFPGVVAGLTYWAIVGRHAGARPAGGAGDARALL